MNVWNWGEDINFCIATSLNRLHMSVVKKSQCVTNVGTLHHIPHANHFYEILWPIGVKINRIRFNDIRRFVINMFHCGWLAFTAFKHQDLRGLSFGGWRWCVVVTVQSGFCEQYVTIFHPTGSGLDLPVRTHALVHGLLPDAQNYVCPGNARKFFPLPRVSDPDMHLSMCVTLVPWCMTGAKASGFFWRRWRGKPSQHSRRIRNPQLCVSGKGPVVTTTHHLHPKLPLPSPPPQPTHPHPNPIPTPTNWSSSLNPILDNLSHIR